MTVHHDGHASGESAAAASWMVAMVAVILLTGAAIVALFVWAPWDDDNTGTGGGDVPAVDEGDTDAGGADVDIEGNIDVGSGDEGSGEGQ